MISHQRLWETMCKKGVTQYALICSYRIILRQIASFKQNERVSTNMIDMLCRIFNCHVEEMMEY